MEDEEAPRRGAELRRAVEEAREGKPSPASSPREFVERKMRDREREPPGDEGEEAEPGRT